jgi:hypothetical protein
MNDSYFFSPNFSKNDLNTLYLKTNEGFTPVKDKMTLVRGVGPETIKIVKNFMSKEEVDILMSKASTMFGIRPGDMKTLESADKIIEKYIKQIKNQAELLYENELEYDDYASPSDSIDNYLVGRKPGFVSVIHSDNLDIDKQKYFKYRWSGHISNLVYLNDNYDGGELYFPEYDLMIKPEPGMLISFPGHFWNRHGILPASDYRFAISIFLKIKDFE